MIIADTANARKLTTIGLVLATVIALTDQISKWWILDVVMQPVPRVIEVTPFFNLVMAWNTGVSFGTFGSDSPVMPFVLSGLAAAIVLGLVWWLLKAENRFQAFGLGLVIGGAIGNIIDRFRFGAVADFLDFHIGGWHFWAFNVADASISTGVLLLLLDGLFINREKS